MTSESLHFTDLLSAAEIYVEEVGRVEIQTMICGGVSASSIFQHPPARLLFPMLKLGETPSLQLGCGIHDVALPGIRRPVEFTVHLRQEGQAPVVLLEQRLDPKMKTSDAGWHSHCLDLGRWAGQEVQLEFLTAVEAGATHHAWAGWSDPCLTHQVPEFRSEAPLPPQILLFITADALRQDLLGCYGHPEIKTPHLDRLAREGLKFTHARTPSTSTLGGMISVLTGTPPSTHGVNAEWGNLPFHLPTLTGQFNAAGWHSMLAASENELVASRHGVGRYFTETLPCLGNPSQDGAVTTRQVLKWLETAPEKPLLLWAQYFDTHPPNTPPEPYRSMYYQGDPRAAASEHQCERLSEIRGVESVADLRRGLAMLRQGRIDVFWKYRLRETARALLGEFDNTPDLAEHLQALGPQAWRGGSLEALALQMLQEASELEEGRIPASLTAWMETILPMIERAEEQILTWLRGVRDLRYPIRQYHGAVSYFDAHLGKLLSGLEQRGLLERTTIVLLSAHGESLTEDEVYFHHHLPSESVLRVPLLVRPSDTLGLPRGREVGGIADLVDLAPTVLELFRLPNLPATPGGGVSRAAQWREGADVPPHDSFSENVHGFMPSIVRWPWKLLRAEVAHDCGGSWVWEKGQIALYDLREETASPTDHATEQPALVAELTDALDAWLALVRRSRIEPRRLAPKSAIPAAPLAHSPKPPVDKQSLRKAKELASFLRQTNHLLNKAQEASQRLYQTKRWRVGNGLRLGKSRTSFPPLDRVFESWDQWRAEHQPFFAVKHEPVTPHALWLHRHRPKPEALESLRQQAQGRLSPVFYACLPKIKSTEAHSLQSQTWPQVQLTVPSASLVLDPDAWVLCGAATDVWEPHALSTFVQWIDQHPACEIIYADHDTLGTQGKYVNPAFKTDWAPEAFLSSDYIGRAAAIRGSVLGKIPDWQRQLQPEAFYGLMLQATELAEQILHVPHLLCHLASPSAEQKQLDQSAVEAALRRRRIMATVEPNRIGPGVHISRSLALREKISIIIPTRNRVDLLARCVESLVRVTDYDAYEIVIVDNGSDNPATLRWLAQCGHRVLRYDHPFNYSAINNFGVAQTDSPWVLLLNNDTEILHPRWLYEMAQYLQNSSIGAVGAKLLFPDQTIQHAGVTVGICGLAAHTGLGLPGDSRLHHGVFQHVRNVSAVTAACLLTKRSLWDRFGGLNETNLAISFNDTHYCLQLRAAGYRIVYTPHAQLHHHESATRSRTDRPTEVAWFRQQVAALCPADPFYNPNLEHGRADWEPSA